jgi:hypothetical protein
MWHEAVIKLCAVGLGTLLLASGGVGASCQSDGSRSDGSRLDDQKNKGREADLPSSEAGTTDQQKQDANDSPQEKASKGKTRFRFGTVTVGSGYTHFSAGVFASPFWGYGFAPYTFAYDPFFYAPFYYPSFYGPFLPDLAYRADKGEVRLEAKPSAASVYLDDAYAGTAGKLKHMWLAPGAYDLTVSAIDGSIFHQRIYVLSGRSLKIKAKFVARNE